MVLLLLFATHALALDYEKELRSLEPFAMTIGAGKGRVYAFIDPLCSMSRDYIELITHNTKLQQINTYYIFLYPLARFKSDRWIDYIYDSHHPLLTLQNIVLDDFKPDFHLYKVSPKALKRKQAIQDIADKFHAKRRPFLLLFKANSNVCKVSEGTAPCMNTQSKP